MERMDENKPSVSVLMHRLANIPKDFLLTPIMQKQKEARSKIRINAIISDMLFAVGGEFMAIEAAQKFDLDDTKENRNFFGVIALMTYLYHDACFRGKKTYVPKILALFMHAKVRQLADLVPFQRFIIDPERREELVRLCLDGVGSAPEGETSAMAKDRLNTLDSVERERLIRKTREAQERAKQLREAMERQAAEEAASKMTRE